MSNCVRARAALVIAGAALSLAGCGGGSAQQHPSTPSAPAHSVPPAPAAAGTVVEGTTTASGARASSGGLEARMTVPGGHDPRANRPWPAHFAVTDGGRPASATVSYRFLLAGQVVARRSFYRFRGHFDDVVVWPGSAIGYPLTFRAVVVSRGVTLDLDYPVRVQR